MQRPVSCYYLLTNVYNFVVYFIYCTPVRYRYSLCIVVFHFQEVYPSLPSHGSEQMIDAGSPNESLLSTSCDVFASPQPTDLDLCRDEIARLQSSLEEENEEICRFGSQLARICLFCVSVEIVNCFYFHVYYMCIQTLFSFSSSQKWKNLTQLLAMFVHFVCCVGL